MEACYGGTDVMERSCAVARGIDINKHRSALGMELIIPGKHPDTRINPLPLALANGQDRYITVTVCANRS
jgi:hypothetical protein